MSSGEDHKKDIKKKLMPSHSSKKGHTVHAGIQKKVKITCKPITQR